jgi:hypothetical protein
MLSLPRPAAARPQPNTTTEFFRVSVAAVLLLPSSFSSKQDYKQDVEALVELIHTNAGLDLDHKLTHCPLSCRSRERFEIRVDSRATSLSLCTVPCL